MLRSHSGNRIDLIDGPYATALATLMPGGGPWDRRVVQLRRWVHPAQHHARLSERA